MINQKPIAYTQLFKKNYRLRIASNKKLQDQFRKRVDLFIAGMRLKDHPLRGNLKGMRAFAITDDIRVIYREDAEKCVFVDVGTHVQVYQ